MQLSTWLLAICIGGFAHGGAAVSIHRSQASDVDLKTDSDPSAIVPADLSNLLNRLAVSKELKVDPAQMQKTTTSLSVVAGLLKEVNASNNATQNSLNVSAARVNKCMLPTKADLAFAQLEDEEEVFDVALPPHVEPPSVHVRLEQCIKDEKGLRMQEKACWMTARASKIARNNLCKLDPGLQAEPAACKVIALESYGMWVRRMQAYYSVRSKTLDSRRKLCGAQNKALKLFYASSKVKGSCKWMKARLRNKVNQCSKLETLSKATMCKNLAKYRGVCKVYTTCYTEKLKAYEAVKNVSTHEVADQKLQWDLLSRANCLSGAIDSSGTVSEDKLDKCTKVANYSTSHLNVTYPKVSQAKPCHIPKRLMEIAGSCKSRTRRHTMLG